MSHSRNAVRILLLGEPNVGKTTLVLSLVSEEFSPQVPAQADEITIPADVTPERVPTQIVDYSSRTQTTSQLREEIRLADVICLVYALNDDASFRQISSCWLPLIQHTVSDRDQHTPIVIVGNKLDLVANSRLEQVLPIMSQFTDVETCIECSAKSMRNLSETFWFAQKAVLYPTSPLYMADKKELTPECIRALTRVFRICDTDNDGYLSDKELEAFQERCFSVPLTSQSLHDVKQVVRQSTPGGVTLNGLTQRGFLFLHLIFVQKGRHETTWTVLRQFGYDNQLRLSNEYLYPRLSVPSGCSTEVSPIGLQFLHTLFHKYDLDRDGCLSPIELTELLATCPEVQISAISDLGVCAETNPIGWITLNGFMAYWALTAYLEPSRVLEYFAYLGFTYYAGGSLMAQSTVSDEYANNGNHPSGLSLGSHSLLDRAAVGNVIDSSSIGGALSAGAKALLRGIVITAEKRLDAIRRHTQRTVFYCRVYGARQVGKTCLLQGLLGRSLRGTGGLGIGGTVDRATGWAAACGIPVYGQLRTLLMQEIGAAAGEQMTAGEALSADVACLVYDVSDPESFRYVANLFLNYYRGTRVPCLFVAAKADQPQVVQNYRLDPVEMSVKYHLSTPEQFSSLNVRSRWTDTLPTDGSSPAHVVNNLSPRRRAGSADPLSSLIGDSTGDDEFGLSQLHLTVDSRHAAAAVATTGRGLAERGRRHSRSELTFSPAANQNQLPMELESTRYFSPVYITLCTLANYPHLRGLELAQTDYAWKFTLAATILAGFGFVAFRLVRPHF